MLKLVYIVKMGEGVDMPKRECGNAQDMKYENRLRVLQMISTRGPLSRASITAATGLSKMSISNITSDLIYAGLVNETASTGSHSGISGRIPLLLELSPLSPCVMGLYIGRRHCTVLVTDLSAKIVTEESHQYSENMTGQELLEITAALCEKAVKACHRKILCVGIASLGPVNAQTGVIISPPNFFGIRDLPIREHLQTQLQLPCFLIHDASAGALAESLYGNCRQDSEFIYLQMQNGIGLGMVLNGDVYDGAIGLCGELGHTSIDFRGTRCACGNRGCLELYANEHRLLESFLSHGGQMPQDEEEGEIFRIAVNAAANRDPAALCALEEYTDCVAVGLLNCINLIDSHKIVLGYRGDNNGLVEKMIQRKIEQRLLVREVRKIEVLRSAFLYRAPTIGAAALAARHVFCGDLPIQIIES